MTISLIVPCFNEEESIPLFHEAMEAVKYQMIVTFMSLSTISIACFITCQLSYRTFFNTRNQLYK